MRVFEQGPKPVCEHFKNSGDHLVHLQILQKTTKKNNKQTQKSKIVSVPEATLIDQLGVVAMETNKVVYRLHANLRALIPSLE